MVHLYNEDVVIHTVRFELYMFKMRFPFFHIHIFASRSEDLNFKKKNMVKIPYGSVSERLTSIAVQSIEGTALYFNIFFIFFNDCYKMGSFDNMPVMLIFRLCIQLLSLYTCRYMSLLCANISNTIRLFFSCGRAECDIMKPNMFYVYCVLQLRFS